MAGEEALERGGGPEVDFDVREPDSELAKGYAYTAEEIKRTKRPAVDGERAEARNGGNRINDARIFRERLREGSAGECDVFEALARGEDVDEKGGVTRLGRAMN